MSTQTIEERNAEFKAMTHAQQRVCIAQDALRLLDAQSITASNMMYFRMPEEYNGPLDRFLSRANPKRAECMVCARGAMFAGLIHRVNQWHVESGNVDSFDMWDKLRDHFSADQLNLTERAFEGWIEEVHDLSEFRAVKNPEDRLRAILRNIIDNAGEFVVPLRADSKVTA